MLVNFVFCNGFGWRICSLPLSPIRSIQKRMTLSPGPNSILRGVNETLISNLGVGCCRNLLFIMSNNRNKKNKLPVYETLDKKMEAEALRQGKMYVKYDRILRCQKFSCVVDSDLLTLPERYIALIQWIWTKCSGGCNVNGIPECYADKGNSLLEVELKYAEGSTGVLISKTNAYIVAYQWNGKWWSFKGIPFLIYVAVKCDESCQYEGKFNLALGAVSLYNAISSIQLSEDSRFLPIQHQVVCGIKMFLHSDYNALAVPELDNSFPWFAGATPDEKRSEVRRLMSPEFEVDFSYGVKAFESIAGLIQNWKHLSKAWIMYAATGDIDFSAEHYGLHL